MADQVAYVKSPAGELGTVSPEELQSALQNGYTQASPEELQAHENEQKYGGTLEQIKTAAEGAASAATFGLSTGAQVGLGLSKPEDIRARRETNPGAYGTGQVAGLIGSALIPVAGEVSAANLLTKAGNVGAKVAGLGEATALAKIGSSAVRAGVENAVFQAGDEVSKMLASDPYQSVETAATNIGLSGIIGGGAGAAIGSISPLWKATAGNKVGQLLDSIKNKAGGIENTIPDYVQEALVKSGIDLPPEMRAGLSNDLEAQNMFKTLLQSDTTKAGRSLQEANQEFRKQANDIVLKSFGKTADDIPQEISKAKFGQNLGKTAADEAEAKISPLGKEYDLIAEKYKNVELPVDAVQETKVVDPTDLTGTGFRTEKVTVPGAASKMMDGIEAKIIENNWNSFEDAAVSSLLNGVRKELPKAKTISELTDLISTIGKKANAQPMNFELKRAGEIIKDVLKKEKDELLVSALGKDAPELVEKFSTLNSAWRDMSKTIEPLQERLGIRGSISSFPKQLREMAASDAEGVLRKLNGVGDASLLPLLEQNFPGTAQALKDFHVTELLHKAKSGDSIDVSQIIKKLDAANMSPELRQFAFPKEALEKANAIGTLLDQYKKAPHNFSNTARTADKLLEYVPASAVGMVSLIASGNPLIAGAAGALTKYLAKDAPDAVRLALLKFMASGQPIESGAFKATVDLFQSAIKGEAAINKAVSSVYKSAREVAPSKIDKISEKDRERLDKKVRELEQNPEGLMAVGGESGYYLPEATTVMTETAGRVINYLSSIRPVAKRNAPLDEMPEISKMEKEKYNRVLDIAEQPLIVLSDIKDGTLTSLDVVSLRTMYPSLYSKLAQKLTDQMIDYGAKEESIPYRTRISLSMFLGQPLDSTMTPESIMGAQQSTSKQAPSQQQPAKQGSVQKIGKIANLYATRGQAQELATLKG